MEGMALLRVIAEHIITFVFELPSHQVGVQFVLAIVAHLLGLITLKEPFHLFWQQ
jgi:hypothetical protein